MLFLAHYPYKVEVNRSFILFHFVIMEELIKITPPRRIYMTEEAKTKTATTTPATAKSAPKKPAATAKVKEPSVSGKETATDNAAPQNTTKPDPPRSRATNSEFFSRDILGRSQRERLIKPIVLKTRTAKSLYSLVYDRIDTYLHRPKELATLSMARDTNLEIQKIIGNRLTELENFVSKRHKKIKNLYEVVTSIESFESDNSNNQSIEAGFSTGYANRYLSVLTKIDDTSYMAGYLEKTGHFDIQQEAVLNSEMYRKNIEISRRLMVFIGRTVIGVRKQLKKQRLASEQRKAS